ncbi:PAS domain-containing protein [Adhaeribacter pallidiroseus]|uniref:Histidine kinase n=1 Tax=Adhaeribacter pallidiroseus TaxID=2072847 RepID=A0A369Q1A3_9BACT|nr:PAS domain-containing protein [Adhaeribacter pallidiroseus]RDC58663.1 Histidine kinase [Adhaeribacter pallidiroseus]
MTLNSTAFTFPLALAEKADLVFFSYDLATKHFTYLNPAFEKVWHTSRQSIRQNPLQLFKTVHSEDKLHVQGAYLDLRNGVLVEPIEFRIQVRHHPVRWISLKALLQEEPEAIMGYCQDITGQKEYTDYLNKFSDKKNAVLNILSHDLAGPLANIESLSYLLAMI